MESSLERVTKSIFMTLLAVLTLWGVHNVTESNVNLSGLASLGDSSPWDNSLEREDSYLWEDSSKVRSSEQVPIFSLRDFNNAIIDIAERTNPTVVTVTTKQTVKVRQRNPFSLFFNDPRFDQEREFQRSGLGSGVIVSSKNGYIVTNNHVIDNADEIIVRLYSGEELEATIVGTDPGSDVAVLQVESKDLPAIPMGNSDNIKVGEMVLAIGSPLDERFAHTVSQGIISASGRSYLGLNEFENYIQTDAAINPGNSGGALVNLDGELIGINTAIASRSGGSQGLGFAIPVNMVKTVMEALIKDGRVSRGFLGITLGGEVDQTMAKALGLPNASGFVVGDVEPGGPAEDAGLQGGDVIVSLNGNPVKEWLDFRVAIASLTPGSEIELEIYRDGKKQTVDVVLGERDADAVASIDNDDMESLREELGFSVTDLSDAMRGELQLRDDVNGVVVDEIDQTSMAYRQGLRYGDVITVISGERIENTRQFYDSMISFRDSDEEVLLLKIIRQGRNIYVAFELVS